MNKEQINFNECIKSYGKFGETVYVDICNNKTTKVPWGITEYGVGIFFGLVGLFFITLMIIIIKSFKEF